MPIRDFEDTCLCSTHLCRCMLMQMHAYADTL